jgi:hypothetical protein
MSQQRRQVGRSGQSERNQLQTYLDQMLTANAKNSGPITPQTRKAIAHEANIQANYGRRRYSPVRTSKADVREDMDNMGDAVRRRAMLAKLKKPRPRTP